MIGGRGGVGGVGVEAKCFNVVVVVIEIGVTSEAHGEFACWDTEYC